MIRAVIGIFLVFSMTFALTAYFMSFKARQYQIRKEMKAVLKAGAPDSLHHYFYLDDIEAVPKDITWIHSKEFRYRGNMYDIISRTEENGRVLLHCIRDVKESGLFAELDRLVELGMSGIPNQQSEKLLLHKLYHSLYSPSAGTTHLQPVVKSHKHRTLYARHHVVAVLPNDTPPPESLI